MAGREITLFACSMCNFQCYSHQVLLKHTRDVHENDPRFLVNCSICGKSATKWSTLRKHFQRCHKGEYGQQSITPSPAEVYATEEDMHVEEDIVDEIQSYPNIGPFFDPAMFLLRTSHSLSLTYSGVEELCHSTQTLIEQILERVQQNVSDIIQEQDTQFQSRVTHAFDVGDVFQGMASRSAREMIYRKHFNYVDPTLVVLDKHWEWKTEKGRLIATEIEVKGYVIDIFEGLKALLSNPSVLEEVQSSHMSEDGIMRNVCDGELFKNHPLFKQDQNALQFILYNDELEVCNPLGTGAGVHKLSVFYYILGNIRPEFRSSLQAVQLLAVAKSKDVNTYGCRKLLEPFIESMKLLSMEDGCNLELPSGTVKLRGSVVCLCGDIPASNFVGGFKEGVVFAFRKCRQCLATKDSFNQQFHVDGFTLRDKVSHEHYCSLIESDLRGFAGYSTTYGVNNRSILTELPYFDVTKCLPFDIMHTVFEASQMKTLIRLLPFVIGEFIPEEDEHWLCLLTMWDICSLVSAFQVTEGDAANLGWLVQIFLEMYVNLYGASAITPKMHYLIHLPQDMLRFGPLRGTWCMRFEAKNKELKHFTSNCFKNVPYSIAVRHQQALSHLLALRPGQHISHFLYAGDKVSSGSTITLSDTYAEVIASLCGLTTAPQPFVVNSPYQELKFIWYKLGGYAMVSPPRENHDIDVPRFVIIHGIQYSKDAVIRVNPIHDVECEEPCLYIQLEAVYICDDIKVFCGHVLCIEEYQEHTRAYRVSRKDTVWIGTYHDFYLHGILHLKLKHGLFYLIGKDRFPEGFY